MDTYVIATPTYGSLEVHRDGCHHLSRLHGILGAHRARVDS